MNTRLKQFLAAENITQAARIALKNLLFMFYMSILILILKTLWPIAIGL